MKDRIYGCMVGGAAGDALGYPVEFKPYLEIIGRYGINGITRYQLDENGVAEISDDTQMTLFTASGCLLGMTRYYTRGIMGNLSSYSVETYRNWLYTQTHSYEQFNKNVPCHTWLMRVPGLYSCRAPGNTCLEALKEIRAGYEPSNNSCGCGGVMRVAPLTLLAVRHDYADGVAERIAVESAEVARITHRHPLGFLPAAALSLILNDILGGSVTDRKTMLGSVTVAARRLGKLVSQQDDGRTYAELWPEDVVRMSGMLVEAGRLAGSASSDLKCIIRIGEGWTGHEALAIALFCAIRHFDSFEDAVVAAVNHNGDSDSTGSICGQIMGAIHGRSAIPSCYTDHLEILDVIEEMADDLYSGCEISEYGSYDSPEKVRWLWVYVYNNYWEPKQKMLSRIADGSLFRQFGMNPANIFRQFAQRD